MWFQQVVREASGCAAYLVGSTHTGECLVFDPVWDVSPYLEVAARKSSRITRVVDSHAHADHVSGARRLVEATGALLLLPRLSEASYAAQRLDPGQRIRFGEVEVEVLSMPGHRPEQINLLIRDLDRGPHPWCLLTADFLMVGDLARPDLAQDGREGAAILFRDALPRLRALPDFVEVYPGHLAGST
jgi:glyoxylase-like metal-dependent hydrolase (beta-lactamase superfamily II)